MTKHLARLRIELRDRPGGLTPEEKGVRHDQR
jgi:hypothetical protein